MGRDKFDYRSDRLSFVALDAPKTCRYPDNLLKDATVAHGLTLAVTSAAMLAALVSPGLGRGWEPDDEQRCLDYGTVRGTRAYFECRDTLDRDRGYGRPRVDRDRIAPPEGEQNISDGLALAECERRARQVAPHPIKRRATSFVFPGREKRATISFEIAKPGSSSAFWNAECKFSRGAMTHFTAR